MPSLNWSEMSHLQLGRCAEYLAMAEFLSYRYEIYPSEVDDHGVDFLVKSPEGVLYEVQVKSTRGSYVYIPKSKMPRLDAQRLVCYLRFADRFPPELYVIPAYAWKAPNAVLVSRDYGKGRRSKPEWGINYAKKNLDLLRPYRSENIFSKIKERDKMANCVFCKIAAGEIPSTKVYEDETVLAFRDLDPQAPIHVLLIPKEHIASAAEITPENSAVVAHIFEIAAKVAEELGLGNGFRIVNNCGADGMQSVPHLHFHLLGGKKMGWPPFPEDE